MRARKLTEHIFQQQIVQYLRMKGILVFETDIMDGIKFIKCLSTKIAFIKHHEARGYEIGQPDLIVILPDGKVDWIECKVGKNKQSPQQKAIEKKLQELGHNYYVVYTLDDIMNKY